MNPDADNQLFSDLAMEDSNLMLVDDILEIIKNEPDLEKADIDQNLSERMEHFEGVSITNEITDTIIDPNDFFNDIYKSEVDYSSTFSSPVSFRSTPSPTTSNSSHGSDHFSVDSSSTSNQSETSMNMYKVVKRSSNHPCNKQMTMQSQIKQNNVNLETPPISPPSNQIISPHASHAAPVSFIQSAPRLAQPIPIINHVVANTPNSTNHPINIIQGTLIPITAVSLSTSQTGSSTQSKKVKIQPKPIAIATKPTIATKTEPTPKRVILSGNDYKNFVLKCNAQQQFGTPTNFGTVIGTTTENAKTHATLPTNVTTLKIPSTMKLSHTPVAMAANPSNNLIQVAALSQNKKSKPKSHQDEIDERTLKKQMRMIKNRESACQSRKKKKEYVNTLEAHLMNLSKENQELKSENGALKERLEQVTSKICDMCGNLMTNKSSKGMDTINVLRSIPKKNTAFLLAFVFMVTLNVGPYISPRTPNPTSYADGENLLAPHHQAGTRGLLWIDDDTTENANSTNVGENSESERSYPMCPVSSLVNQTESIRLASELQRWIGDLPEFLNLTKHTTSKSKDDELDLTNIESFLLSEAGNAAIKSFYKQMKNVRQIRRIPNGIDPNQAPIKRRQQSNYGAMNRRNSINSNDGVKHVQIFNPEYSNAMKYATFFEEIHRQDDTFYVVSFRADHLLLPALAHNKTFRPKMSLMLPAWNLNNNNNASNDGLVTLMQIDCEVLNTSMIRIKESSIPENLRNRSATAMPTRNVPIFKTRNPKVNHKRPVNSASVVTATPSGSEDIADTNSTNVNDRLKSTTFDNYNTQKLDTVKNYKPYFLRNRANARNIGN